MVRVDAEHHRWMATERVIALRLASSRHSRIDTESDRQGGNNVRALSPRAAKAAPKLANCGYSMRSLAYLRQKSLMWLAEGRRRFF